MTNVSGHIGTYSSLATAHAGSSASVENQMPDPAQFSDPRWKELPTALSTIALSRFDQDICTNNHGISQRAMCFGLSLSWINMIHAGKDHATPYASAERMRFLGSFEGVVHARTLHNFYRTEHKFLMEDAAANPGVSSGAMAGTESLLQTAELKGFALRPVLEDTSNSGLPFRVACKQSGRQLVADDAAIGSLCEAIVDNRNGVLVIYSEGIAHALGFSVSADRKRTTLFDPNLGEFHTHSKALASTIKNIASEDGLSFVGVQIFASKRR
ncbi:YopT-type cysteine protease domain-containing protein [Pseudomonas sp. CDFA 602]|uniref:YopT-type cysteine protease domain-containing protein n=1 Tax=Pseudomonas californiensis TaxID=2829823 RepID=UPI001E5F686F|nr:YopT-type cysteine protease domain-containing protein [Pseudomonas californiensis]MCD5995674.1 YopT-type cysteine protease domain-containing protein [Pseudomonas californiensis]MCD6001268.1 YopT-type cysteine protease domain-containing protein [Pseudomonas californiensis]